MLPLRLATALCCLGCSAQPSLVFGSLAVPSPTAGPVSETDLSIPVSSQSVGAISANAFSGLISPTGSVSTNSSWTASSTKYIAASDYRNLIAKTSNAASRDMEVDTWARDGIVFFRLTLAGKAIYFYHNGETSNGTLEIGIVTGFTEGVGYKGAGFTPLYTNAQLTSVAGYSKTDTTGAVFTFGVSGLDVYAKLNGTEFVRLKDFRHVVTGALAIQANNGYGFRNTAFRLSTNASIYSDPPHGIFDMRDMGLRSTAATGSISASSNQLTLVGANPGFVVGDQIIVAVGGESGAGLRGTVGVGGTWPALSYANSTAMLADTGQPDSTYAWLQSTGDVWNYNGLYGAGWLQYRTGVQYYYNKVIPIALVATVTAIGVSSGNGVLTLSGTASVSTTGASVYLDNYPALNAMTGTAGSALNALSPLVATVKIPSGVFALSHAWTVFQKVGWVITGVDSRQTTLLSPPGVPSISMGCLQCNSVIFRDLTEIGNARFQGYGIQASQTFISPNSGWPQSINFNSSPNSAVLNINAVDVFQCAACSESSDNFWAYNMSTTITQGILAYTQWMYLWSNAVGGGCVDCSVTSPNLVSGFSTFNSQGTSFYRPIGFNALAEANSSGAFLFDSPTLTVTANTQPLSAISVFSPMINVNSNTCDQNGGSGCPLMALGGTIRNPTLTQTGYIDSNNNSLTGINVNHSNPNVVITGTFQSYPGAIGTITIPNYNASSTNGFGALGISNNSGTAGTSVTGIRVIGTPGPGYNSIYLPGTGSSVSNSVADTVTAATKSGNLTNAQWNALHP